MKIDNHHVHVYDVVERVARGKRVETIRCGPFPNETGRAFLGREPNRRRQLNE